jgi:hypothetical protein
MQLYGSAALRKRALSKSASDVAQTFYAAADDIWINSDCDRCEALRKARLAHPKLYKALQAS